jgi:hypothetical protein
MAALVGCGDDALFDYYVNSTPFLEYIKERFLTWTGRLGGETAVFVSFSLGIWFCEWSTRSW